MREGVPESCHGSHSDNLHLVYHREETSVVRVPKSRVSFIFGFSKSSSLPRCPGPGSERGEGTGSRETKSMRLEERSLET